MERASIGLFPSFRYISSFPPLLLYALLQSPRRVVLTSNAEQKDRCRREQLFPLHVYFLLSFAIFFPFQVSQHFCARLAWRSLFAPPRQILNITSKVRIFFSAVAVIPGFLYRAPFLPACCFPPFSSFLMRGRSCPISLALREASSRFPVPPPPPGLFSNPV